MQNKSKIFLVIISLIMTTLACGIFTGTPSSETINQPTETQLEPPPLLESEANSTTVVDIVSQQDQLVKLYHQANPGVVSIRILSEEGGGLGSGFVIDQQGYIVTNYHVVQGSTDLEVDFPSGYKTYAEILGTDRDSDLAVIKVDAPADELVPLNLGDSDALQVGQIVIAIGNPLGYDSTMTTGVVSSIGRTMQSLHEAPGGGSFTAGGIIQTDAAINPGNSGGPLLNLDGEVIGVNVAIQTNSFDAFGQPVNSGIGFSIPINIVKRVVPSLIEQGYYDYPYLGIRSIGEITLFQQEALDLPQSSGVYIIEVTEDGPADQAGLRGGSRESDLPNLPGGGDLIIAIDGVEVRDFNDMITYLISHRSPGDTIVMTVLRDNEQMDFELEVGKRP